MSCEVAEQRPLAVLVLEDKIVQRATVEVLNCIYEVDFTNFSYGFRPGRSAHGNFIVLRETRPDRMQRQLRELKLELRRRLHQATPTVGKWLRSVLPGHYRYFGVPRNWRRLKAFRFQVDRLWCRSLRRRSQRCGDLPTRFRRLAARWLPPPRLFHPYPEERLCVIYPR